MSLVRATFWYSFGYLDANGGNECALEACVLSRSSYTTVICHLVSPEH